MANLGLRYPWKDKRFLSDVFFTLPSTILFTFGFAGMMGNWALGGSPLLGGGGFIAILGSAAYCMYNLCFNGDKITLNIIKRDKQDKIKKEESRLSELALKQKQKNDRSGTALLNELKATKAAFEAAVSDPQLEINVDDEIQKQFRSLFWLSITQLEKALHLKEIAKDIEQNKTFVENRNKLLLQVSNAIESMKKSYEGIQELVINQDSGGIDHLSEALKTNIKIAKEVNEEMSEFTDYSHYENLAE